MDVNNKRIEIKKYPGGRHQSPIQVRRAAANKLESRLMIECPQVCP